MNLPKSGDTIGQKTAQEVFIRSSLKALFIICICKVEKCACINVTDTNLEGWKEGELRRILTN